MSSLARLLRKRSLNTESLVGTKKLEYAKSRDLLDLASVDQWALLLRPDLDQLFDVTRTTVWS